MTEDFPSSRPEHRKGLNAYTMGDAAQPQPRGTDRG